MVRNLTIYFTCDSNRCTKFMVFFNQLKIVDFKLYIFIKIILNYSINTKAFK